MTKKSPKKQFQEFQVFIFINNLQLDGYSTYSIFFRKLFRKPHFLQKAEKAQSLAKKPWNSKHDWQALDFFNGKQFNLSYVK
jgi:hypothetical protein